MLLPCAHYLLNIQFVLGMVARAADLLPLILPAMVQFRDLLLEEFLMRLFRCELIVAIATDVCLQMVAKAWPLNIIWPTIGAVFMGRLPLLI